MMNGAADRALRELLQQRLPFAGYASALKEANRIDREWRDLRAAVTAHRARARAGRQPEPESGGLAIRRGEGGTALVVIRAPA